MSALIEFSESEMRTYFQQLGMQIPVSMRPDSTRSARWSFLTENLEPDIVRQMKKNGSPNGPSREYMTVAKAQLEQLLENTLVSLCMSTQQNDLLRKHPEMILEEFDSTAVAPFVRMALPIIRRIFPKLFAMNLVNVQTMTQPTGNIFYMDTAYGTDKAPTKAGDRVDMKPNPVYGGGESSVLVQAAVNQTVFNLNDAGTNSVKVYVNGALQVGGGVNYTFNKGLGPDGVDQIILNNALAGGEEVIINYSNYAEGQIARDIDLEMRSDQIKAVDWALRGVTTVQALQDFQSVHGINGEAELNAALTAEIDREIDVYVLFALLAGAKGGNVTWDSNGYLPGDDNTFFRKKYRATLYEAIVSAANLIFAKRYMMPTWIVGGIAAIERLEKLEEFKISLDAQDPESATIDRYYNGSLNGWLKVYKAPRFPANKLLLGFKGPSPYQSGAVFAPYVPVFMTDMIPDPNINFKARKGLLSRNGFKITIPECYATVTIV